MTAAEIAGGEMAFCVAAAEARLPVVRDFSGFVAVITPLNTEITLWRWPGVVGLNLRTAIVLDIAIEVDRLAFG